jgi:peptide chain release factor 3
MTVNHLRIGKKITLAQPQQFMAQDRNIVEDAYAGDIIGIFDPGHFRIGDTLISSNRKFEFDPIPVFPPEDFARVAPKDSMKRKQFLKGIEQLSQEGAVQLYKQPDIGTETYIMGVVGVLQFDVFEYRMKNEYGVDMIKEGLSYEHIRWIDKSPVEAKELKISSDTKVVSDMRDRPLLLFTSEWNIRWALERNEGLVLSEFSRGDLQ